MTMKLGGLSLVFPVAYDWRRACEGIARLWPFAEEIIVGWDRWGKTWGGGNFMPPTTLELQDGIEKARGGFISMSNGKLRFCSADFHVIGRSPKQLQLAERNALSYLCSPTNWICQVDADEEWCNPEEFVDWAKDAWMGLPATATAKVVCVYKVIGDTALVCDRAANWGVGCNQPGMWRNVRGGIDAAHAHSPLRVVNWWMSGRTEGEIRMKLNAVSYFNDGDVEAAVEKWQGTTLENFQDWSGGVGSMHQGSVLKAVSVADLLAGKWSSFLRRFT